MKFAFTPDYEEISPLLDGPYNDPQKEEDYIEEEFEREYEIVRGGVVALVKAHCERIGIANELIDVGHRTGPSRGVGLVVDEKANDHLLSLVESVHNYLRSLDKDYCVPINLVLDEGKDFKDLNLGITRSEEVLAHSDKAKWFRKLGIRF